MNRWGVRQRIPSLFRSLSVEAYVYLQPMTDPKRLSVQDPSWLLPPIFPFLLYFAAVKNSDFFWVISSWDNPNRYSPAWSFFPSHANSLSFAPSLPPTNVSFKNLNYLHGHYITSILWYRGDNSWLVYLLHIFNAFRKIAWKSRYKTIIGLRIRRDKRKAH